MRILSICALVALVHAPAYANDFSLGGSGADLYPREQTEVVMQSEVIELIEDQEVNTDDSWSVIATYVFANRSTEEQALTLGFPEQGCPDDEWTDCGDPTFHGMQTTVDGIEVEHRLAEMPESDDDTIESLGRVWVYDVQVPAAGEITVVHRYRYHPSGSTNFELIDYITRTGALWSEPIGRAEFRVWFEHPVTWAYTPESWGAPEVVRQPADEESGVHSSFLMRWVHEDWVPSENLQIEYGSAWFEPVAQCPSVSGVMYHLEQDGEEETLTWLLSRQSLDPVSARRCRNLMYAEHGYAFTDAELAEELSVSDCWFADLELGMCWHREPSDAYSEALLGYDEHRYIELMQAVEDRFAPEE